MALTANPLAEAATAVNDLIEATPAPKKRGTLLIVDDEDGPRQSLRVIFKDEYDLLMAEDGPTAIDLAQKHDIDVAVLDIRMAGMSGIEVLERLKYVKPEIEAIMMTAFETTDTIRQALRLRACDYINKPFDIATMRAPSARAMQRRVLESEIHTRAGEGTTFTVYLPGANLAKPA
jgi:DNA-binding NtrC family response regulator